MAFNKTVVAIAILGLLFCAGAADAKGKPGWAGGKGGKKPPVISSSLEPGQCRRQSDCSKPRNTACVGASEGVFGVCKCKNPCKVFGKSSKAKGKHPNMCTINLCSSDQLCVVDSLTSAHCEFPASPVPSPIVEEPASPVPESPVVEEPASPILPEASPSPAIEEPTP